MTPVASDTDWWTRAACTNKKTRLFFTTNPQRGKEICARCPVRPECLYDALQSDAPNGIWGGLTTKERRALPAITGPRPDAIATLRDLLHTPEHASTTPERTDPLMTTAPAPTEPPAVDVRLKTVPEQTAANLPVGKLLKWGDDHPDAEVQDQAARARAALAGLRQRYAADQELTAITTEAQQLEKRLAELRAREQELAPAKPKKTRKPLGYPVAEVRAWAKANNLPCSPVGRCPKAVVDAWREATGNTA